MNNEYHAAITRRAILQSALGFGVLALNGIATAGERALPDGQPHFAPKAKRVIWLFMRGGVSHMESFDPKPALNKYAGKSIDQTPYKSVLDPAKVRKLRIPIKGDGNGHTRTRIFPLQTGFKKYGQSGIQISDWFPQIGSCADDIAFIRSMWTSDNNHGAQVQFHSGRHILDPRVPTIGAWINYGLGSLSDNLPQFINIGPRFFDKKDAHYPVSYTHLLGTEVRDSHKHLWRWRDWIVNSLNENKGYDQMLREMVAGDEIAPADPQALAATGFLARNWFKFNRTTWLDNTIEHTSKAFMGLTMNCAKCHDHKYDPITHLDLSLIHI